MVFKGQPAAFRNPRQAQDAGIVTIYQELNLVPYQSITENIFLGSELTRGGVALRWSDMHQQARELLAKLHLDVDPRTLIGELGVGKQQMVEVAKAIYHKADLIIMDEPTSSLSIREINDLFGIVRELKEQGVSVVYISHHLEEIFQVSDRTTVLRDGQLIKTSTDRRSASREPDPPDGRAATCPSSSRKRSRPRAEVLRVEGLNQGATLRDINFSAYAGEVLGIAGLVGAGRTELVRAVFGADPVDSGTFYLDGQKTTIKSSRDAVHNGIGLLTEDRKRQGLFLQMTVRENITMSVLERLTRGLMTNRKREAALSQEYIDSLAIKTSGQDQLAINLSGGTQQKVVLSKWLATKPRVLIFDEPTRGIDVGAKVEIYRMMNVWRSTAWRSSWSAQSCLRSSA